MYNIVILMGRLVADPELRYTKNSNIPVTAFTLAVDRKYQSGSEKATDFFNIVAWRNTAEFITKYFTKGKPIIITGELQNRNHTNKDGVKKTITEVIAESVRFAPESKGAAVPSKTAESSKPDYDDDYYPF